MFKMVSTQAKNSVRHFCPLAKPEPSTSLAGPPHHSANCFSSISQSLVEDDTKEKDCQSVEKQDLTATFPTLRVYSNYAEIQKERQNPFSHKPKGVMKMNCDTTTDRRVVTKVGKINTHRKQRRSVSV